MDNVLNAEEENINNIDESNIVENNVEVKAKACKVLYWNKISKMLAFDYDGITIQIKSNKDIENENFVNINFENNTYTVL